jgi:hypothetical protein
MTSKEAMSGSVNQNTFIYHFMCPPMGYQETHRYSPVRPEERLRKGIISAVEASVFSLKQGFERTEGFVLN